MKHLEQINKFREEFQGRYYTPLTEKDLDRIEAQENVWFLRQLDKRNNLVGLAVVSIIESLTRKVLTIEDFIIAKKYRGQGYGKDLMKIVIRWAKKKKVDCIEVCTKETNIPAHSLNEKFGFKDRKNIAYRLWLK